MLVLLDTGILLRAPNRDDLAHGLARGAVRVIRARGDQPVTTLQNISEFWNVCTRPLSARSGFGLTVEQAERRLRIVERFVSVLPEPAGLYARWRDLVMLHRVLGAKVHDVKLVAAMDLHGITQIVTFNERDFARFPAVTAVNPATLVGA